MIHELGLNILVVDALGSRRALLRKWLESGERLVLLAGTVEEAWSLMGNLQFDIVVCASDCAELCAGIRKSAKHSGIYIMLVGDRLGAVEAMGDTEADDLIELPLEEHTVRLRIRAATRIVELRNTVLEQDATLRRVVQKMGTAYSLIESDLQEASAIQLGLLPTISEVHTSVRAEWLMLPSSFLTGDNLNYFMMQDRYLIFYQADVAGHGIPSALLSVTLSQLLSPEPGSPMVRFDSSRDMKRIVPPVDVVTELNRRFVAQDGSYFTMLYGVLDAETGEVRFCQAGHPSPLRIARDRTILTVGEGGFPVGLWPDMTYDETRTTLTQGERLVLYSDGLLECMNPDGLRYPLERLRQILTRHAEAPIKDVLRMVQEDLESWSQGGSLKDDVSMLIIESR